MTTRMTWSREDDAIVEKAVAECESIEEVVERVVKEIGLPLTKAAITLRWRQVHDAPLGEALNRARRERGRATSSSTAGTPRPVARPTDPAPAPRYAGAPIAELDFDNLTDTLESQREPARPAPVPDPVADREKRDETVRLRSQLDDLVRRLREANARHAFIESAAVHREPPRILPRERVSGIREMTAVVLASDWHVEEPVDPVSIAFRNEYNLEIASQRIERFFREIIWNFEHHRASGRIAIRDLVLWLGGDLYSGFIHDELIESNELSPVEVVRWLLPRLRDGIATLLEHLALERLVVPCSHGNHGRTTKRPRVATGHANSFDWLLYHSLADEFRHDRRVEFFITASAHQYVQVYDATVHFHHGDEVKYQGGVGGLGIPLLKAVPMWDSVKPADLHCIGHWHQLKDYGRAIVNGSLIGFNAYAQSIRAQFELPRQAMFYLDTSGEKSMLTPLRVSETETSKDQAAA